jgi:hypothetical protein
VQVHLAAAAAGGTGSASVTSAAAATAKPAASVDQVVGLRLHVSSCAGLLGDGAGAAEGREGLCPRVSYRPCDSLCTPRAIWRNHSQVIGE